MFGNILGGIAKIFGGSAHEKALKEVQPVVDAINEYYNSYSTLSNDELRGKTTEFKSRIAEQLKDIDNQLLDIQNQIKYSFNCIDIRYPNRDVFDKNENNIQFITWQ